MLVLIISGTIIIPGGRWCSLLKEKQQQQHLQQLVQRLHKVSKCDNLTRQAAQRDIFVRRKTSRRESSCWSECHGLGGELIHMSRQHSMESLWSLVLRNATAGLVSSLSASSKTNIMACSPAHKWRNINSPWMRKNGETKFLWEKPNVSSYIGEYLCGKVALPSEGLLA